MSCWLSVSSSSVKTAPVERAKVVPVKVLKEFISFKCTAHGYTFYKSRANSDHKWNYQAECPSCCWHDIVRGVHCTTCASIRTRVYESNCKCHACFITHVDIDSRPYLK